MDMNLKPLYLATNLNDLCLLIKNDVSYKYLKKVQGFSNISNKMKTELLQCQDDQEKCYILSKRFLNIMDHLFKICDDRDYIQRLYLTDIQKVTELAEQLEIALTRRYEVKMDVDVKAPASVQPPVINVPASIVEKKLFKGMFISPKQLYQLVEKKSNVLILDARVIEDFKAAHLIVDPGHMINVPEGLIMPGLSANTLGQLLGEDIQPLWDKREKFLAIVLIDLFTDKNKYSGSKIERLRGLFMDWDVNRLYHQHPVVLDGGIREYVEWYPSKVENSHIILSTRNTEIDELLHLDEIEYPEPNEPIYHSHLRVLSIQDGNIEHKFKRDNATYIEPDDSISNISEVKFIKDKCNMSDFDWLQEDSPSSTELPFEDALPNIYDPLHPEFIPSQTEQKKPAFKDHIGDSQSEDERNRQNENRDQDEETIRKILEANKNLMLEQARKNKPQLSPISSSVNLFESPKSKEDLEGDSRYIIPPPVDRSAKPSTDLRPAPAIRSVGTGYSALQNKGNTCFMNAILQCVKFLPIIKATYVTSDAFASITTRQPPLINYHFAQVMRRLWEGTEQRPLSYSADTFKTKMEGINPEYKKHHHEDAFEFFLLLFNTISDDCAVEIPRPPVMTESQKAWYGQLQGISSFFVDSFFHQIKNTRKCEKCRSNNLNFETDSTLMLAVPNKRCTLKELIADYVEDYLMDDYTCPRCKSVNTVVNQREVVIHPDVLAIVLKRYHLMDDTGGSKTRKSSKPSKSSTSTASVVKNNSRIEFPLDDLEFGLEKYTLSSIVHHTGSMGSGHYFASVLMDVKTDAWVIFNDNDMYPNRHLLSWYDTLDKEAVGFFYVKKPRNSQSAKRNL